MIATHCDAQTGSKQVQKSERRPEDDRVTLVELVNTMLYRLPISISTRTNFLWKLKVSFLFFASVFLLVQGVMVGILPSTPDCIRTI